MADIFKYIPLVLGVRNNNFSPFVSQNTISSSDVQEVHKSTLATCSTKSLPCVLIFENELYLTRNLADINNNEIRDFILANNVPWDLIIVSTVPDTCTLSDIEGHALLKKMDDTSVFLYDKVYIASASFMQKCKNNDLSNIQTFVYTQPFLASVKSEIHNNKFIVGQVKNIMVLKSSEVKYTWAEFQK